MKSSSKKTGECSYHLCKKVEELFQCRYCKDYFCKEHLRAKPAGMPHFRDFDANAEKFMEEYRKKDGHPCIPYVTYWKKKIKDEKENYQKSLKNFLSKKREELTYYGDDLKRSKLDESFDSERKTGLFGLLKKWLRKRYYYSYDYRRRLNYLIWTLILFITSLVGISIFYSNAQKLNGIELWIINLGGILVLSSIFFTIKFGWKLGKEIFNIVKRQQNWFRYLVFILIIFLLWYAYSNKNEILNPFFDIYTQTDFGLISPIKFTTINTTSREDLENSFFQI